MEFGRFGGAPAGSRIGFENGAVAVPDDPVIPFIRGDGTGPDIWKATQAVLDAAVKKAFGARKRIAWFEVFAGETAHERFGDWLPQETVDAISYFRVAIKGPLTTPIGGGFRSLNVTLRQLLDLYACIRPVRWFENVPSPVKRPQDVDMIIFRENIEDVYAGIEWKAGSPEADRLIGVIGEIGKKIRPGSAIGVKPVSEIGCKRLVRKAIRYAIDHRKPSVTLVHKGNIMKYTEGAFRDWGYEVARTEFADHTIAESDLGGAPVPAGKVVVRDRIADSMFQQALLRPAEYSVVATTNLNGDYLSDALAAQVGGLGMAPGSNEGIEHAVFEATHGTAPKYANLDKINPSSLILSGVMMLEYLGWRDAAAAVERAVGKTLGQKIMTYDLARQTEGAKEVGTSGFAQALIGNL
ncbi:MAG TPA: isocitrate dehydrogenase (NADP(+)) [Thermoanaerobaculia bacterium]|nr:isocitrate dehydrogenase (NADP(+)) [Thermoanaerobaculia bacterium]